MMRRMPVARAFLGLSIAVLWPRLACAEVKNPDTYTTATISDADSLDPAWAWDTYSNAMILNIYEPLLAYAGSSTERLIPLISTKVPSRANGLVSADGKTYRFPIRKGVVFHDGTPMTPEDVRYSIIRFLLFNRDGGPSTLLLEPLLGYASTRDANGRLKPNVYKDAARAVQVQGNDVVLRLPKPFVPILSILAEWGVVVSKQWAIRNGDWDGTEAALAKFNNFRKESSPFYERANGTGPFMLERWDRRNKEIVLARNDRYWRKPARLARIISKGINEFGTRKLMLQAGDADDIYSDWSAYSQVENIPGTKILLDLPPTIEINPVAFFTFRVNASGNPYIGSGKLDGNGIPPDFFSDKDVRKGFAYAFDYKGYIRDVFHGKATQPTGCIPESLPGHNPKQETYHLDLAKAREHLKKAWGGKVWENGFVLTLVHNAGNAPRASFCQILKRSLESLNPKFKVDVRAIEWPTFLDAYQGSKLPVFILAWQADYPDAHDFAAPMLHSGAHFPGAQGYSNPEADRLIDAAVTEQNSAKRKALYARLQAIEFEDVPHLLLINPTRYRIARDWVRGWVGNPVFPAYPWDTNFYPVYKSESK